SDNSWQSVDVCPAGCGFRCPDAQGAHHVQRPQKQLVPAILTKGAGPSIFAGGDIVLAMSWPCHRGRGPETPRTWRDRQADQPEISGGASRDGGPEPAAN